MLRFTWDPAKARRNLAKHGVSFEEASHVFADPSALMLQDRVVDGEERWQAVGRAASGRVLVVAHAARISIADELIRIISARRALRHERNYYERQAHKESPTPFFP